MKTKEEAAREYAIKQIEDLQIEYADEVCRETDINVSVGDFLAGAEWMQKQCDQKQRWISVGEPLPECNHIDEEGIRYSDCVLIKSKNLEFPVTGVYIIANDDEFFDTFSNFDVMQEEITHWRPIE